MSSIDQNLDLQALKLVLERAQSVSVEHRNVILAGAVLHWFNEESIRELLGKDVDVKLLFSWLINRPFVERFGETNFAIHERTRDILRAFLLKENFEKLRDWSEKAVFSYRRQLGEKSNRAEELGPTLVGMSSDEKILFCELIYHQWIVDQNLALQLMQKAFKDFGSSWQIPLCRIILQGYREQLGALSQNQLLWFRHYEARLISLEGRYHEDLRAAVSIYEELLSQILGTQLRAWTTGSLASTLTSLGEWEKSEPYFQESLILCRELSDKVEEATVLGLLGGLYLLKRKYKDGLDYFKQGFEVYNALNDQRGRASMCIGIGKIYQRQGNNLDAVKYLEKALMIYRELGDRFSESVALTDLALIYYSRSEWEKTEQTLRAAFKILPPIEHPAKDFLMLYSAIYLSRARNLGAILLRINWLIEKLFGAFANRFILQVRSGQKGSRDLRSYDELIKYCEEIVNNAWAEDRSYKL